ncbi:MAG: ABC transporter substrate-binding protein [Desulfopila sp.]
MKGKVLIGVLTSAMLIAFSSLVFADEQLEIGALYPISGGLALLGEESWRGAEIARIQRNKQGGIGGKEIVFVKGDASTVSAARSEAERLVEQKKVKAILGTYSSSRCMAASEVTARKKIPYFELGAIANNITERGYKTIWRTNPTAADFSRAQVDFLVNWFAPKVGKKTADMRIGIAHEDSDYGTSVADAFVGLAKDAGMQVVSVEPYAANSSDLSSVIFRLRQAKPDIVVAVSYANDAILLSRQALELKLKCPILGTGGGHSLQSFVDALGDKANGVFDVDFTQYRVNRNYAPGIDAFLELYRKTFKENPRSGHSLCNYMGANVVFDIIEAAGGLDDMIKIAEAAKSKKIDPGNTPTGWGVNFDDTGQNVAAMPLVTEWINGELVTVWPKNAAVEEPIIY